MTTKTITTTIDKILDESFIAREQGILVFKEKIAGLDVNILQEPIVVKTGSSLVPRQKRAGLDKNMPLPDYLQKNPMAQYLIKNFSDAQIHVATGYDDFNYAVYVTRARFGFSQDVQVRLKANHYKNQDPAKMVSDRLGDIYSGMHHNGFGKPFFHEENFRAITRFLKENLLNYLAALIANQKQLPSQPKRIAYQRRG